MKTTISILDKIAILLFFVLLSMASFCFGGVPKTNFDTTSVQQGKDSLKLTSFTAREVENKIYVNWYVISNFSNYYFVLERSYNGTDYAVVNVKKGFKSPCDQVLQFCFTDAVLKDTDNVFYRIKLQKIEGVDKDARLLVLSKEDLFRNINNACIDLQTTQSLANNTTNYSFK